jgi:predicted phage terminase large subunit-like protein
MEPVPHKMLCDFVMDPYPRKLIVGCRGIFKTSVATVGRVIQHILINPNVRILIVSNTARNAKKIVSQIKTCFESNELLRQLYPEIIPEKTHDIPWSGDGLLFNRDGIFSEPTVTSAGVDAQLASGHYNKIIMDDPVAADMDNYKEGGIIVLRPEEVAKFVGWYKVTMEGLEILGGETADVQITMNRWGVEDGARYIIDHDMFDSEKNPDGFKYLELSAHKEDGELLWPEVLTEEKLSQKHQRLGDFMYFTQYECKPYNPENRGFSTEYNTYWSPDDFDKPDFNKMKPYCLVDIADADKPESCMTAVIVVYVDNNNHFWVSDAIGEKMSPIRKMEIMDHMVRKHNLRRVYIEENLHARTMKYCLTEHMKQTGMFYGINPLKHKNRDKDSRIVRLTPHHEYGALHIRKDQKELIREMRDWPNSSKKDLLDALGYIMDIIQRPPTVLRQAHNNITYEDRKSISLTEIKRDIKRNRLRWGGQGKILRKQTAHRFSGLVAV